MTAVAKKSPASLWEDSDQYESRQWRGAPPTPPSDWVGRDSDRASWITVRNVPAELDLAIGTVPTEIEMAINDSVTLLSLQADWDAAGASPIKAPTRERAVQFLRRTASQVSHSSGRPMPPPRISPCPDGSIDLYWRTPSFTLLINIPPTREADFYGKAANNLVLKGSFNPDLHTLDLLRWLLQIT
jgi:hypothetical protein